MCIAVDDVVCLGKKLHMKRVNESVNERVKAVYQGKEGQGKG